MPEGREDSQPALVIKGMVASRTCAGLKPWLQVLASLSSTHHPSQGMLPGAGQSAGGWRQSPLASVWRCCISIHVLQQYMCLMYSRCTQSHELSLMPLTWAGDMPAHGPGTPPLL